MFSRFNHPCLPALVTAVFYFTFLLLLLSQQEAGLLPQAGDFFADSSQVPDNLIVLSDSVGYDGQYYFRLALDPFTREKIAFGLELGNPRYRHQRILYPLLAWLFAFGSQSLIIYSLIWVNFLALILIGYVGGKLAQSAGRSAILGVAFSLFPGFLYTLSRDLVEITEAAFVLLGLLTLQQQRKSIASSLLALAVLAKETALLTAVSLITEKKYRVIAILPLAVYGSWQLFLNWWWRDGLAETTPHNVGWPFVGILEGYWLGYEAGRWLFLAFFLGFFLLLVALALRQSAVERWQKVAWLLYTLLLLSLTKNVWIESLAFLRAASLFYLWGTAVLLQSHPKLIVASLVSTLLTWLWLAHNLLGF